MPSPSPSGTLKRPPARKAASSPSPSLSGMEQSIPSFKDFVSRTPPPDLHRPLPPTPLMPRRPSSFDSASSRPTSRAVRRSSSIYSRTLSQWDIGSVPDVPSIPSWQTADFAEQNLLLRPIAYSASTSQLIGKLQPEILEPRVYTPLINTPSPTVSRTTTPSPIPSNAPRPSILLPPPVGVVHVPKKHLRMVSLEQAKEMLQAPGAVHLLPEELRAQTLGKARSQEPLRKAAPTRMSSTDVISGRTASPELPQTPTLVYHVGRERLLSSPIGTPAHSFPNEEYPFPALTSPLPQASFHVGTGPARTMAPLLSQPREESRAKAAQALGLGDADEARGRTRSRGPRNMSYEHYLPKAQQRRNSGNSDSSEGDIQSDAQNIAREYHILLSEQYRQTSSSPTSKASTDTDVGSHMKMVPQPLFHTKPARRDGNTKLGRDSDRSVSPFHARKHSEASSDQQRQSSGSRGPFSVSLSTSFQGGHRRRSTSGSIPISPPSASLPYSTFMPRPKPSTPPRPEKSRSEKSNDDSRVSAYYPHVMSRKKGKGVSASNGKSSGTAAQTPPLPMLAADIIAERLKTLEGTPDGSPSYGTPPQSEISARSDTISVHSQRSGGALHKRAFKSAVKTVNKLRRSSANNSIRRGSKEPGPADFMASPDSPHLLPSPGSTKHPPAMQLGWSDVAKNAFDEARSSIQRPKRPTEPVITHIQTVARPLDESKGALAEPDSPRSRKGSIFGGIMDGWRESKAEKRRHDLKRMIKVVTPADEEQQAKENGSPQRPVLMSRRWSAYNWM